MRILETARHPGAAEAVGPVVGALRSEGHEVLLIGVSNDAPENKTLGGSAAIVDRQRKWDTFGPEINRDYR